MQLKEYYFSFSLCPQIHINKKELHCLFVSQFNILVLSPFHLAEESKAEDSPALLFVARGGGEEAEGPDTCRTTSAALASCFKVSQAFAREEPGRQSQGGERKAAYKGQLHAVPSPLCPPAADFLTCPPCFGSLLS